MLTHDAELTATGAETKIDYQKDFDFYLERLFKGSPWAISVMEYFNKEVFNSNVALSSTPPQAVPPSRTWEDDFLQELDNPTASARTPSSASNVPLVTNCHTSMSISQTRTASTSSSTQLQLDISHLSLAEDDSSAAQAQDLHGLRPSPGSEAPIPAQPLKRVTRSKRAARS